MSYHPEKYWSEVAERIEKRNDVRIIAGDDSPYYRYKRNRFLSLLDRLDLEGKELMELGSGPGGNLRYILENHKPKMVTGADISKNMIKLAGQNLSDIDLEYKLEKIDGTTLPFSEGKFDLVFSATVLQHNTDDSMMRSILTEMARVSKDKLVLFERIENNLKGDDLCMGRPVDYYSSIVEPLGYKLKETNFINIQVSYIVSGIIRKVFNPSARVEGQQISTIARMLQKLSLPITSILDRIFKVDRDLGMLTFQREQS